MSQKKGGGVSLFIPKFKVGNILCVCVYVGRGRREGVGLAKCSQTQIKNVANIEIWVLVQRKIILRRHFHLVSKIAYFDLKGAKFRGYDQNCRNNLHHKATYGYLNNWGRIVDCWSWIGGKYWVCVKNIHQCTGGVEGIQNFIMVTHIIVFSDLIRAKSRGYVEEKKVPLSNGGTFSFSSYPLNFAPFK